jgi:SPP1 family predicted phage head-tail adaptor
MQSYRLRHRIAIQEPIRAQNAVTGEITDTWVNYAIDSNTVFDAVPAEVLTGPGKEQRLSGADYASTDARINIRWFEGLNQAMRILWDGRIYNITSIETDITGRREWRIRATEGLNDG